MRRVRQSTQEINISFLDVICCGFGAIVLLLLFTRPVPPVPVEETRADPDQPLLVARERVFSLRDEAQAVNRDLDRKRARLSVEERRIAALESELNSLTERLSQVSSQVAVNTLILAELETAKQKLTEEMQRLRRPKRPSPVIGGIPVDSEYIVFIIDTSGSMFNYGWDRMLREFGAVLDIYPRVKGLQVMNDMGEYMFSAYRRKWIPDTPARRRAIRERLKTWNPFSNSSPVEGIERAIRTYYDPDKKISLYVFGDEFTGPSIETVVRTVDRLNKGGKDGKRRVRIHAVGFPVQYARDPKLRTTGIRFATLMRELAFRNGGTFVGLNDFR